MRPRLRRENSYASSVSSMESVMADAKAIRTNIQSQQSAACNARHMIEARMCRWLLRMRDLADSDNLLPTQEFLAQMLGVQLASVSIVASGIAKSGADQVPARAHPHFER